jgi:hypothetical protein
VQAPAEYWLPAVEKLTRLAWVGASGWVLTPRVVLESEARRSGVGVEQ